MKKGTKEFYAAQDCFERTLKSFPLLVIVWAVQADRLIVSSIA